MEIPTESLNITDYKATLNIVDKYARSYWKKANPKVRDYVFQDLDDVIQSLWVVIIERKNAREIVSTDTEGHEAMLTTIIKRGLVDYIRSHVGRFREEQKSAGKRATYLFTTLYMDYTKYGIEGEKEGGDLIDWLPTQKAMEEDSPEDIAITNDLKSQLDTFLNNRLRPRELMVYDMVYRSGITMKEVGKSMGVTESRICQIIEKVKKVVNKDIGRRFRLEDKGYNIW